MAIKMTVERDARTDEFLSVYFQIREGEVGRTLELDKNCLLDLSDTNQAIGLEILGPFSLRKAREAASMYFCPELESIFAVFGHEPQLVQA